MRKYCEPIGKWEKKRGYTGYWRTIWKIRDQFNGLLCVYLRKRDVCIRYHAHDNCSISECFWLRDGKVKEISKLGYGNCHSCAENTGGDTIYYAKNLLELLPEGVKKRIRPHYIR